MRNAYTIILFKFSWMFIPIISLLVPFTMGLGLSMKDFFLLQSFFGLVVTITEVPSGYIADLVGRKKMLVIGGFLSGVGFSVLYFSKNFTHLLVYEGFIGLALSFVSGADYSLLFDSLKHGKADVKRADQALWTSRFLIAGLLGEAVSAVIGGILGFYAMSYVVIATALCGWLPFIVSFFLTEASIKRMDLKNHKDNFRLVLKHIFLDSKFLRVLFINFVIWSLSTMSAVWLIQKYWEEGGLSFIWFGFFWAGYSVLAAILSHYSSKIENLMGTKNCLLFFAFLISATYFIIPILPFRLALIALSFFYIVRGVFQPIFREAFNHRLKEEFRATANSIVSLVFRLSFMVVGPLLGLYVDNSGISGLFTILGGVFLVLILFILAPLLRLVE